MKEMTVKEMEKLHGRHSKPLHNISLKYKIAMMTALVALIPMITLACLMVFFYNRAIMERGNRQIQEGIKIMSDRISAVIDNGTVCSNNFTISLSSYYNDRTMKEVTRESRILAEMGQDLLIYRGISSIVFLDDEGLFIASDPKLVEVEDDIRNSEYVSLLQGTNGKTILMDAENNPMSREDKEVITLGKKVINTVTGASLGYVLINMDKENLIESAESEISYYFLFDNKGYCISKDEKRDVLESGELQGKIYNGAVLRYDNETYLIGKKEIETYHWTLVGITNINKFNVSGEELRFIMLITSGVAAALLLVSIFLSVTLITRPLIVLHDGAEKISEGDMSVRFHFKTRDEIGQLGRIFNYMTERNRELLIQVDEEAKKKREYELSLIQEQVKPHFLYNTLDIIIMLIEMSRSREAARVTQKLANYYKNSLSGSEEIISIEREVQITRDYLDLQVMRYGDKFKYSFDIDEEILGCDIPKMTLQPLVENAIYHGLKYKEDWGSIEISGKVGENKDAVIVVKDDGIGIDPSRLISMQDILKRGEILEDDEKKHFGVYSVDHRIRLYFGDEYGINIESIHGEGTTITIRVPMEKK